MRNVSMNDQGIPFAKKSLTIEFSDNAAPVSFPALRMELREMTTTYWAKKTSCNLETLTIVGYGSGLKSIKYPEDLIPTDTELRKSLIRAIRHFPASRRADFRYRIVPSKDHWGTGEGWNDWLSFVKEKESNSE